MCLDKVLRNVEQFFQVVRLLRCDDLFDEFFEDDVKLLYFEATKDFLIIEIRQPGIKCI